MGTCHVDMCKIFEGSLSDLQVENLEQDGLAQELFLQFVNDDPISPQAKESMTRGFVEIISKYHHGTADMEGWMAESVQRTGISTLSYVHHIVQQYLVGWTTIILTFGFVVVLLKRKPSSVAVKEDSSCTPLNTTWWIVHPITRAQYVFDRLFLTYVR